MESIKLINPSPTSLYGCSRSFNVNLSRSGLNGKKEKKLRCFIMKKASDAKWATGLERASLMRLSATHIQVAPSLTGLEKASLMRLWATHIQVAPSLTGLERASLMRLWATHIQVAPSLNRWLTPRPSPCVTWYWGTKAAKPCCGF